MNYLTIIGQLWGACAMVLIVISFQFKDSKRLFLLQVCSCTLFTLHYLFLGLGGDTAAYSGMAQNAVGLLFRFVLTLSDKYKSLLSPMVLSGLCTVTAVVAVLTYPDRLIALLPVIANYACIGCMWTRKTDVIRVTQLAVISPCWLIYNCTAASVAGILTESFNILSIGVYYLRAWRRKRG
ncbi:MAG: YgjV family protein [Clostridia bacterium]|nr:YgjV family protein [Clostridia bacterium]